MLVVVGLEAEAIALSATIVVDIRYKGRIVFSKQKLRRLAGHFRHDFSVKQKTIGCAIVVDPELDADTILERYGHRVVLVLDLSLLIERCRKLRPHLLAIGHLAQSPFSEDIENVIYQDVDPRLFQYRHAIVLDTPSQHGMVQSTNLYLRLLIWRF